MEEVAGFTQKQRRYFLERDNNRCMFHQKIGGKWVRCSETRNLQIHHIVPRGWARENMGLDFPVNSPENGITLCRKHHVGWGMGHQFRTCVHTDNESARISYSRGNKKAYHEMMDVRVGKCRKGVPYWNTEFDWQFMRMAKTQTEKFNKPFPQNGNRYANGRVKHK